MACTNCPLVIASQAAEAGGRDAELQALRAKVSELMYQLNVAHQALYDLGEDQYAPLDLSLDCYRTATLEPKGALPP